MYIEPLFQVDFYKPSHGNPNAFMYPENTTNIYSNLTPRKSRMPGVDHVVVFGPQYFIMEYLIEQWNSRFFNKPKEEILSKYLRLMDNTLGKGAMGTLHLEKLHDLGFLPLEIKCLPEGTLCPIGVPMLTIEVSEKYRDIPLYEGGFAWLVNYLETIMSCTVWQPITSATIAYEYKKILSKYAQETTGSTEGVQWQGHDFSMRGMSSLESACTSGAGHLISFTGTDTIPAISFLEQFYGANVEKELVGASVPATEHSVECMNAMGTMEGEYEHTLRLLKLYPTGIVSKVSDTTDLWSVITIVLPQLKDQILKRGLYTCTDMVDEAYFGFKEGDILIPKEVGFIHERSGQHVANDVVIGYIHDGGIIHTPGKLVIRPDSGDPVDIICGSLSSIINFSTKKEFIEFLQENVEEHEGSAVKVENDFYIIDSVEDFIREYSSENLYESLSLERFSDLIAGNKIGILIPITVKVDSAESKGVIELLWDIFGGTVNEQGYKVLDPHIGAIYGDSITLDRATQICERLKAKGFASTNIVLGIGSYTYQYNTRDTFGFAVKATYGELKNSCSCKEEAAGGCLPGKMHCIEPREIFKDPITDDGTKKSKKGLLAVVYNKEELSKGNYVLECHDQQTRSEEKVNNLLETVFLDGELTKFQTLSEIRERLSNYGS